MTNIEASTNNLRILLSAIIFVIFGIAATSKLINLDPSVINLVTQIFLYLLFICSLSFRGYYFKGKNERTEFIKKFMLFSVLLLPTGLIWWSEGVVQLSSFMASFLIMLFLCLADQIKVEKDIPRYTSLFLWTLWTQISAIIIFRKLNLLPLTIIQKIGILHLDTLGALRLIIGIALGACLLISAIAVALKSNPIWGPYHVKEIPVPKATTNSSDFVKLFYLFVQTFTIYFINPIVITLICNLLLFGIVRLTFDFLFRVCHQVIVDIWRLFAKLRIILSFLLLYIFSIAVLFFINAIASPLIHYLKFGDDSFSIVVRYAAILFGLALLFKVFVTLLFTELVDSRADQSFLYTAVKEPLFSNTMGFLVVSILLWLSSGILWALSIHNFLQLEGFNSWGLLSQYYSYFFVSMIIITMISIRLLRDKATEQGEEKPFLKFVTLNWTGVFSKPLLLLLFIVLAIALSWYSISYNDHDGIRKNLLSADAPKQLGNQQNKSDSGKAASITDEAEKGEKNMGEVSAAAKKPLINPPRQNEKLRTVPAKKLPKSTPTNSHTEAEISKYIQHRWSGKTGQVHKW